MKLMIASDLHGSAYYTHQLLDAWDREGAPRLFLLGDILYHGPRNDLPEGYAPKEVLAMLNERKDRIFCVRGNCDGEVDQMVLDFPIMADYAVLPIENSSAGIVSENYDLMVEYDNCIVGEQIIQINHALLGLPDAELSDITDVYSHPQALMQCGRYLESHREWEKHSLKNTAMAAKKVKEDGKKHKAAIASSLNVATGDGVVFVGNCHRR